MKNLLCSQFQETVKECLIRHRSILDVTSKLQEAQARISRAIAKSVTTCGCIQIDASRQRVPSDITLSQLGDYMDTHLQGQLCEQCKEVIEAEMGSTFFYLAALCNSLDINLYDVLIKEQKKLSALGVYYCS